MSRHTRRSLAAAPFARRVLAATVLAFAIGLAAAEPAVAHARLLSSTPVAGARLARAPAVVGLHFSEPVSVGTGSLTLLDHTGRRIATGPPEQPGVDLTSAQVRLPAALPPGSYAVAWRVVSADGHPVAGTFSFGVAAAALPPPAQALPDAVTGLLREGFALTAYAGAVLLVGVPFFLLAIWPAGLHAGRPRRLLRLGWWSSVAGAAGLFAVQGPYGAGLGPGAAADANLLGQTVTGRVGLLMLLRLFVLGLAVAAGPWPGTDPPAALRRNGFGLAVLFLPTFALTGHSGEGPLAAVAVATDAIHLGAAAVWLGGLVTLLTAVLVRPVAVVSSGPGGIALAEVLRRWSRLAMAAVAALVVTGAFQAWREVGSPAGLDSGYGRLLLAKLTLVAVLVGLGDQARRRVRRLATGGEVAGARRLRGCVLGEVAVGAAVLALTSVLVGTAPARQQASGPISGTHLPGARGPGTVVGGPSLSGPEVRELTWGLTWEPSRARTQGTPAWSNCSRRTAPTSRAATSRT